VMGSRPRSPSAYPADWWAPESGRRGLAKRGRSGEPGGPESESEAPPHPDNRTEPAAALTSVVVLAADCALHLALNDVDLVLEPEPTSVLQVPLGDRTLMLVPEAVLGSGVECPGGQSLPQGAFLSAPGESLALEQGFFCAAVPEIACQEETIEEGLDTEFLSPVMGAAAGSVPGLCSLEASRPLTWASGPNVQAFDSEPSPLTLIFSPERRSPHQDYSLDLRHPEPFSNSPLQPLPPSPSPGPHKRPQRPQGPARKARKCLFPE
uniref:Proline-rich protein 23C n=1 Tax=Catagonus wagneri TaxID=51154 RepID=A0A8C3WT29_9CETA